MSKLLVERSYRDGRVGEWKTTTRGDKPAWCAWDAQALLDEQASETFFVLSGDVHGPYPRLLDQVYRILSHLAEILEIADTEIRACTDRGSVADFFVSAIGDWDTADEILQVELAPVAERILTDQRLLFWPGQNPDADHRIVIRTRDVRIAPGQLVQRGLV
jgi:hypothetical protein